MKRIKELGKKTLQSDHIVFTFLRSAVSSQAASWVDLGTYFVLFTWVHLIPFVATAIGATLGGIINCIINYKFTFHADGCSWRAVAVKYVMVWAGSLLLNAFGTQVVYLLLMKWTWLRSVAGFTDIGCASAARLGVSLAVSWFWNFVLQRYFVYRPTRFDPHAVALVEFIKHPFNKSKRKPFAASDDGACDLKA